jgi:hypothetical protein
MGWLWISFACRCWGAPRPLHTPFYTSQTDLIFFGEQSTRLTERWSADALGSLMAGGREAASRRLDFGKKLLLSLCHA